MEKQKSTSRCSSSNSTVVAVVAAVLVVVAIAVEVLMVRDGGRSGTRQKRSSNCSITTGGISSNNVLE